MKIHERENHLNYLDYVKSDNKNHKIYLIVDGIHCGSCVWLIENTLRKQPNVLSARLNLSTKRLVLEWDGTAKEVNTLIKIIEKLGYKLTPYNETLSESINKEKELSILKCIAVSGFAAMSIMMISLGVWAGNYDSSMDNNVRGYLHWISSIIAIPAALYAGVPFLKSAFQALKAKRSNMDVPISIAIVASCLISLQQTIIGGRYTYYDAAVSLVFFLLIGRYLDIKARNKASERAQTIILSQVRSVTIIKDGKLKLLDISKAKPGEIAFIAAGEKIPVDGTIIDGESEVDNSLITGETLPIKVSINSHVIAGTINLNNPIKVRITKTGDNTVLGEIINLMEMAEQGKAKYVRIADKVASFYTPSVITLSLITLFCWMLMGANLNEAMLNAVTVMIITCPCALGLAVPVVQVVASSRLMKQGILIKTPDALEKLSEIEKIVFDKTGTLTLGRPVWTNKSEFSEKDISLISSIAANSKHPLSNAVHDSSLKMPTVSANEIKGMGLEATKGKTIYKLGNRRFCGIDTEVRDEKIELWFRKSSKVCLRLVFEDDLKEDSKELVSWFAGLKMQITMLSGDRRYVVSRVASKLGISNYKAEVSPVDKYEYLNELAKQNIKTLMVGDGLNDSAALKAAHVSISPASALDIAQTTSDIVIQGDRLSPVKESYIVAKFANKLVIQNFALSFAYNIVTIPIAMSGLATPILAAIAMSLSSIMVVANSLRLNNGGK